MPETTGEEDRRVGAIIERHVLEYRVAAWLDGSTDKGDRPTLSELESLGYRVTRTDEEASDA